MTVHLEPKNEFRLTKSHALVVIALAVSIAYAAFSERHSRTSRLTNVDLTASQFPSSYMMLSKTEADRCFLVDRRDSTMRRSQATVPGKSWHVAKFGKDVATGGAHFLLRSKRYGTVFFLPAESVTDRDFPFYYEFVRRSEPEIELPPAYWTQLYINRIYEGIYLRVHLPFDPRKKDGGTGTRRELLSVHNEEMTIVDSRFNAESRLYATQVADGHFPELRPWHESQIWLDRHRPYEERIFLLSNIAPHDLTLLPLPVSVNELYTRVYGSRPETCSDERFQRWTEEVEAASIDHWLADEAQREAFQQQLAAYRSSLDQALQLDRTIRGLKQLAAATPE